MRPGTGLRRILTVLLAVLISVAMSGVAATAAPGPKPAVNECKSKWKEWGFKSVGGCNSYVANGGTVPPPPNQYLLTVTTAGAGGGTVASSPTGISCPSDCDHSYATGTEVTLVATPAAGSRFDGFAGACTGSTCSLTMNDTRTVMATFSLLPPPEYQLDVTLNTHDGVGTAAGGRVTSSPVGIDCGVDCSESYVQGTSVILTPIPAEGYQFDGFTGACTGTSCQVTMSAARSVEAHFSYVPPVVKSLTVTLVGGGTVTSTPAGISCGADCTEVYLLDTSLQLTASPAEGYTFTGYTGDCSGTTCSLTMGDNKNVTAEFTAEPPPIQPSLTLVPDTSICGSPDTANSKCYRLTGQGLKPGTPVTTSYDYSRNGTPGTFSTGIYGTASEDGSFGPRAAGIQCGTNDYVENWFVSGTAPDGSGVISESHDPCPRITDPGPASITLTPSTENCGNPPTYVYSCFTVTGSGLKIGSLADYGFNWLRGETGRGGTGYYGFATVTYPGVLNTRLNFSCDPAVSGYDDIFNAHVDGKAADGTAVTSSRVDPCGGRTDPV